MALSKKRKRITRPLSSSKIKSPRALKRALTLLRRSKKSQIVFTNGCFDLLHAGHVRYLEEAKRQGTHLVVALNSDASVKRLNKGPERPLNTLQDRASVIAGLESVDFVTWFEKDTPLDLVLLIKPDCLVKGGDWKIEEIVGGKEVQSWGGKVKSLRFVPGKSTTSLVQKIKKG